MTSALVWTLAAVLQVPQGAESIFAVSAGEDGSRSVAADQRSVDCLSALQSLTSVLGWNLVVESAPLENDLRFQSIDLNLAGQDPRVVAQLIAVAAGADCLFAEAHPVAGSRPTAHVVRAPSSETESGRHRLRTLAGQWYRSFLRDELQYEPLIRAEGVEVRLHLGDLLVESGDLEAAIEFFTAAYEQRPHDHVAEAILKVAECHLDIARGQTDRARQQKDYEKAEQWARRLIELMPGAPEATPATVLLGRSMLGRAGIADREAGRELAE
jgi:tetratricopeptide (TPR) repeat protein